MGSGLAHGSRGKGARAKVVAGARAVARATVVAGSKGESEAEGEGAGKGKVISGARALAGLAVVGA